MNFQCLNIFQSIHNAITVYWKYIVSQLEGIWHPWEIVGKVSTGGSTSLGIPIQKRHILTCQWPSEVWDQSIDNHQFQTRISCPSMHPGLWSLADSAEDKIRGYQNAQCPMIKIQRTRRELLVMTMFAKKDIAIQRTYMFLHHQVFHTLHGKLRSSGHEFGEHTERAFRM